MTVRLRCVNEQALRARTSIKWSRVEGEVIAADIAELDFHVAPAIRETLMSLVRRSDFGYPDFTGSNTARLIEAYVDRQHTRYRVHVAADRVELCGQIMQALCCAILAYTKRGDVVLTHCPTYPPIRESVLRLGRRLVTTPVDELPACVPGLALIVLCHPHNPTGHVFSLEQLEAIGELARRHGAVVFADEIYQDLVYQPAGYRPAASASQLQGRLVSFTSAAKSFHLGGMRCGVGHFDSAELYSRYTRLPWHLRDGASLPGMSATLAAWTGADDWLDLLTHRLAANLARISLPGVRMSPPQAGFLCWLDFSGTAAADNPHQYILNRAKVRLQAGTNFGPGYESFARLNFGTSARILNHVVARMRDVLS